DRRHRDMVTDNLYPVEETADKDAAGNGRGLVEESEAKRDEGEAEDVKGRTRREDHPFGEACGRVVDVQGPGHRELGKHAAERVRRGHGDAVLDIGQVKAAM